MKLAKYLHIRETLFAMGHRKEWEWAENVQRVTKASTMAQETVWVICNSGMKYEIAKTIFKKCSEALMSDIPVSGVFKNKNKARAIQAAWDERLERFVRFVPLETTEEILSYFQTFDGIGPITKYHLARNCGIDVCKPDRHLVRIAKEYSMDPEQLCSKLARESSHRIGAVDVVLWRAAVEGLL